MVWSPCIFLLGREVAGNLGQLLIGVTLGKLVHHGGGPLAALEVEQFLQQLVLALAGERDGTGLGPAIGAVAVGAGSGPYLDLIDLCVRPEGGGAEHTCREPPVC
jgi:hypothetical protein